MAIGKEKNLPLERLYRDDIFPKSRGGGKGLLDENEIELLAQTFIYRDKANLSMSRNEAISLVMEMAQTTDRGAAENHFDYLVRMERLIGVKNHGRTAKAQATTTKRSQITVDQQLRWHTVVEEALEFQKRVNLPKDEYEEF